MYNKSRLMLVKVTKNTAKKVRFLDNSKLIVGKVLLNYDSGFSLCNKLQNLSLLTSSTTEVCGLPCSDVRPVTADELIRSHSAMEAVEEAKRYVVEKCRNLPPTPVKRILKGSPFLTPLFLGICDALSDAIREFGINADFDMLYVSAVNNSMADMLFRATGLMLGEEVWLTYCREFVRECLETVSLLYKNASSAAD